MQARSPDGSTYAERRRAGVVRGRIRAGVTAVVAAIMVLFGGASTAQAH
jgi:hypothetical protein